MRDIVEKFFSIFQLVSLLDLLSYYFNDFIGLIRSVKIAFKR